TCEVKWWDLASGKQLALLEGAPGFLRALVFAPDGKRLATATTSLDVTVRVWDLTRLPPRLDFKLEGTGQVTAVVFAAGGKTLVSGDEQGKLRLWDAQTGKTLATLDAHPGGVSMLACDGDGKTLLSCGSDKTI